MASQVTLKQLRYFDALAETRHYRKAAERVGVSQPSLSQQIVGLEAVLGLELVERGNRGAILTSGGHDVLAQARVVLDEAAKLMNLADGARNATIGTLRLGSSPTLGPYMLPQVMGRLHIAYPSIKVIVKEAASLILQEELLDGQHDLILTQLPVKSADLQVERLFREPLKLVVPQDHPMAQGQKVREQELSGQDLFTLSSDYILQSQIVDMCEELGARLRQDYQGTSLDALRQMVALNMGMTFLPSLYVHSEITRKVNDVTALSFRNDRFTRSVGLVWRKRTPHLKMIERMSAVIRTVAMKDFKGLIVIE